MLLQKLFKVFVLFTSHAIFKPQNKITRKLKYKKPNIWAIIFFLQTLSKIVSKSALGAKTRKHQMNIWVVDRLYYSLGLVFVTRLIVGCLWRLDNLSGSHLHSLWRRLPHKLSKLQSQTTTILLRTTPTQTIHQSQTLNNLGSEFSLYCVKWMLNYFCVCWKMHCKN